MSSANRPKRPRERELVVALSSIFVALFAVIANAQVGTWPPSLAFNHPPNPGQVTAIEPIHGSVLPTPGLPASQVAANARVLVFGYDGGPFQPNTKWAVFLPEAAPANRFLPNAPNNIQKLIDPLGTHMCGSHGWLPSGNLILAGGSTAVGPVGTVGTSIVDEFSFSQGPWGGWVPKGPTPPTLEVGRWYPGSCRFSDDRVGFFGGHLTPQHASDLNTYEVYRDGIQGFDTKLPPHPCGGPQQYCGPSGPASGWLGMYARIHQLADTSHNQEMFIAGPNGHATYSDPSRAQHDVGTAQTPWTAMTANNTPREFGGSVLLPVPALMDVPGDRDRVMNIGGKDGVGTFLASTEVCYASRSGPGAWNAGGWDYTPTMPPTALNPPLNYARNSANVVILPSGEILVLGGTTAVAAPRFAAELLSNAAWILGPLPQSAHDYHSIGLLLPSGRVLLGGGEFRHYVPPGGAGWDYEIFEPWYITAPNRPTILTYPSAALQYNLTYTVGHSEIPSPLVNVAKVVLTRPGTCTHGFDMGQRYVDLQVVSISRTTVTFKAPPNARRAPQGWYMLWLVSDEKVPSEAVWVYVQP